MSDCSDPKNILLMSLWKEHQDALKVYIQNNSQSKADAEDIFHDVFIKFFFGLENVRKKLSFL